MEYSPYDGRDDFSAPTYTLLREFVRPDGVRGKRVNIVAVSTRYLK